MVLDNGFEPGSTTEIHVNNYTVDDNGCFVWNGYLDRNGYGRMYDSRHKQMRWAHRVSYEFAIGAIPEKMELDHTCENTKCINPSHLDIVTKLEHARRTFDRLGKNEKHAQAADLRRAGLSYGEIAEIMNLVGRESAFSAVRCAIEKGLVQADELPHNKNLTDDEMDDIRVFHTVFGMPQTAIAKLYGVDSSWISRIVRHDFKWKRPAA